MRKGFLERVETKTLRSELFSEKGCQPGNPKVAFFWYSADLSSKTVFVEAKSYLYAENVFVGFPFGGPFDC